MNDVPKNEPSPVSQETRELLESLGFAVYEGPVPFDELPFPVEEDNGDFEWAASDPEICRLYQRQVVAVRNRKVWGVGKDGRAAYADARKQPDCPAPDELIYVPIWGRPWKDESAPERSPGS
jgi:hypothetical protein